MMLSGVYSAGVLIVIQRLKVDVTGFKVSCSLVPFLVPHCFTIEFWGTKFGTLVPVRVITTREETRASIPLFLTIDYL